MNYSLHDFLKRPFHSGNPYELSHTILRTLPECERKFQKNQLLYNPGPNKEEQAYHIRGSAYGAGVQAYLLTGDMNFAQCVTWLSYYPETEDLLRVPTISQARTINNLLLSKRKLDEIRNRYDVAYFNGKSAIELSFKLHIDGKWYYIGHIDIVLYDKIEKIYVVLDVKTTVYKMLDLAPVYRYSAQCLGYSIPIDAIVGESQAAYGVLYLVCRDKNNSDFLPDVYLFDFRKNLVDRLRWFYTLKMDVQRLNQMEEMDLFPLRENGCVMWGKVCSHYGFCHLTSGDVKKKAEDDKRVYDFEFDMDTLIQSHIDRIGTGVT